MPTPVAVKNAGIPDPPARIRSASVPCGVSSTSSSPERYCRANSLFSPTYDDTIRRIRFAPSSRPEPPVVDAAVVRDRLEVRRCPASSSAPISTDGIPHSPNPPTASVAPSGMSATASAADATTLSTHVASSRSVTLPRDASPRRSGSRMARLGPSSAPTAADWSRVRLHVVTGKGGTGKSTVAAALALALASHGKNVLLCEVEGRQGIARMFDVDPLPYDERRIATGLPDEDGAAPGVVHALHIDAESALLEYLAMYYKLGRAGRALDRFGVIEFATTIAPGVRDVLLTGKVYEAVQRNSRNKGAIEYDAVVLDAPPTGRITQFLNVNDELAGLAKVGPVKSQADTVMTLLRSPRTAVHLVTVLEEMPVQETVDGIAELRAAGLPVGGVVVNLVRPRDLGAEDARGRARGRLDRPAVAADLKRGRRGRRRRRWSTGCSPRRATTPSAGRSRTRSASWSRGSASRRTSCPGWPAASTSAASTSWPARSRDQGMA